jgi:hypothetical protein
MAKNLKQLREKAVTKGPSVKLKEIVPPADNTVATQRFIKKHVVAHHEDPAGNGDDVYNASNIKPVKRSPEHGYDPGQDEEVYENVGGYSDVDIRNQERRLATVKAEKLRRRILGDKGIVDKEPAQAAQAQSVVDAARSMPRKRRTAESYEEHINEVLDIKNMSVKQVIDDFIKSKDKRFAGKSRKERIKMALGAWYDANPKKKKTQKEEYSSVSEMKLSNPFKEAPRSARGPKDTTGYWKGELALTPDDMVASDMSDKEMKQKLERLNAAMSRRPLTGNPKKVMDSDLKVMRDKAAAMRGNPAEQVLANLYNTLNEENRQAMLKLMESEEGFIKLVEFAVEKGID